ncbi:MAG: DUF3090 domain-containing protein [Thermoflexales bacterium]|nr:DUF3090 domain-containing protein [Thermoflexales bacterium]
MAQSIIDLNPVTRITAGAIGEPGQRTFYIQGRQGSLSVTLVCEKEQVQALAVGIEQLLMQLAQKDSETIGPLDEVLAQDMALEEPVEPLFRIGQMGLGYDEEHSLLVLVAQELMPEDQDPTTASVARFWLTPVQGRTLARYALEVVAAGRPRCQLCGAPLEAEGEHFCPRKNGHKI